MSETDEARLERIKPQIRIGILDYASDCDWLNNLAREALASRARIGELDAERVRLWNELRDERGKHDVTRAVLATLRAQVETLRSALASWSREADNWPDKADSDKLTVCDPEGVCSAVDFTAGDLRRARDAYASTEPGR